MRIFISTGEVSGDLQGALLVEALQRQAQLRGLELEIYALGGERMAAAGAILVGNTTSIGSVGLLESLPFVLPTLQVQRQAKAHLQAQPPDLLVLIDYLGPNLAIGSYARQQLPQVPIAYYIAPQDWVWSPFPANTRRIVAVCDRLLAIFPEEARYFARHGAKTTWVGHPIVDRMQAAPTRSRARAKLGIDSEARVVALLPASRRQEIKMLLPLACEAARRLQERHPDLEFIIPLSLPEFRAPIEAAIASHKLQNVRLVAGDALNAIATADVAITKSGTTNLEIAWLDVPQVVIYRVNPVTAWLVDKVLGFSIPFMSPTNLVLMEPVVPELLQAEATPAAIAAATEASLAERREEVLAGYERVRANLGKPGASDRAAGHLLDMVDGAFC
ncbi:MAG: lipid-A-disaccharide synthase [Cyanobacteria bacterium J06641_5]